MCAETDPRPSPPTPTLGPARFRGFHDAYPGVLRDLLRHPQHRIATRGNSGPERMNVSFQLTDPTARVALLAARKTNIVFNLAEVLWFLSGRDDLAMIRHYAPRMASYSADGRTIAGAAYGTRLLRPDPRLHGRSPFEATLDLIRSDPDTKRAVLPIFQAHEVGNAAHPDVSCTIALQLLLRGGALHGVCYMRANDAYQGLVSDVFSFTFIQELGARLLGVELGTYSHHVGSMHIADRHLANAEAIVAEADHLATTPQEPATNPQDFQPMPAMPSTTTLAVIAEVCAHEERLRANQIQHTVDSLTRTGLPSYWQRIIALLELYRQITYEPADVPVTADIVQFIQPAHRWLAHHRWPSRIAAQRASLDPA